MSQMIESFLTPSPDASIRARSIELDEADAQGAPTVSVQPLVNPLHGLRARLQVCVGEASMTVAQLLAAREGEVLVLDRGLEEPVDLLLEGKVVARGELMAVDGSFAVRITELPLRLSLG